MAAGEASDEEILQSIIGQPTGRSKVVIERGPVANFADAVIDPNPIYKDPAVARAAGLPDIPAPPTFPIALEYWGRFAEIQPESPAVGSPLAKAFGHLMSRGGLILHGEQEFTYHRPVVVGDVLVGEGKVADAYQKESKGHLMTFIITETTWVDEKTGEPAVSSSFNVMHRT
ncbi:MAG TPA: MaoC family dehydratase N-terminal domain-containing protein [Acidimicrobiales bacterium]|nr:MaoC family dehydratase N-terminal domain-containing protein [Acidimicrobiales bacterium]